MSKKRGDIVYAYEKWSHSYIKAMIKEVKESYYVLKCLAIVDQNGTPTMSFPGTVGCRKGECFSELSSLIRYRQGQDRKQMEMYEREIYDLKSLLAFPLKYCVSSAEEYTDELAQKVYKKKILEYLYIDLDEEE